MSRFFGSSLALFSIVFSTTSQAATLEDIKSQLQSKPYMMEKTQGNDELFNQYCIGDANSAEIPQPRYSNSLVLAAAKNITASKEAGNARLKELAQEEFAMSLDSMKTYLNEIIAGSKNKTIVENAKVLLAEISKANVTSVSEQGVAAFEAMTTVILKDLKKEVSTLAPKLKAELQGINVQVFTKLAKEMNAYAQAEIKGVDYKKLAAVYAQLFPAIQAAVKPVDYGMVQIAMTDILQLPVQGAGSEMLTSAQEIAGQYIALMKKGAPKGGDIESANYYISDVNYYIEEMVRQGYAEEILKETVNVLKTASNNISLSYMLDSAEELNQLLQDIDGNKEAISYTAESVMYTLESSIEGNTGLFDAKNEKVAIEFIVIVNNFKTDNVLQNLQSVLDNLALKTDEGNSTAFSFADSLMWSLEQTANLSAGFKKTIAAMKSELAKQQSQNVIDIITKADADLKNAQEFDQEVFYSLSNINYYLQDMTLSAGTQQLVAGFQAVMDASQAVVSIKSYISSAIGEGKEVDHFYFYGGIRRLYNLSAKLPSAAVSAGANKEAHWFLVQLCGEFRDRATMIEAKLKWVQNMNILAKSDVTVIEPATLAQAKNVWMRITAKAYYPYIRVAESVWEARRSSQERYITVGSISDIDNPVPGLTVCETKYVMAAYVAAGKEFDSIVAYDAGYENYKQACPKEDLTDYYDFRGDSNFKHYSPESNGMIWYATSLARGCTQYNQANNGIYTDADCENYFKRPFAYRYNAARAGLAAWLFRDDAHSSVFSSQGQMVAIYPHKEPQYAPFSFGFSQTSSAGALFDYNPEWLAVPNAWNTSDIGFNGFTGLGSADADQERAYVLIRDAVDRHTDWYSSGYNDSNGVSKDQAYSPFVASSYVMSSSDGFTQCGTTVQCPDDGLKRWMFVFRIKAQNWYTPARIADNEPIDFDKMWFDETSFGVSGLADSEHAWDRLGTAQEEELDSILYLVNVSYEYSDEYEGEYEGDGEVYSEDVEEP